MEDPMVFKPLVKMRMRHDKKNANEKEIKPLIQEDLRMSVIMSDGELGVGLFLKPELTKEGWNIYYDLEREKM